MARDRGRGPATVTRRRFLATATAGAAVSIVGIAAGRVSGRREVLRPPGAVEEDAFLSLCARCGRCIQVCPTSALRLSGSGNGLGNLMTPLLVPSDGYCLMPSNGCQRCIDICPPKVLQPLPIEELTSPDLSKVLKMGTAILDTTICVPYAHKQDCVACIEVCPVEGAITAEEGPGLNPWEVVTRPVFNPDVCVGCGACEYACVTRPVVGRPAVTISPAGARRTTYRG